MTVPYTFANATGSLPLVELDLNFASLTNSVSNATGNITFSNTTISTATANSNIIITTNSGNISSSWIFGASSNLKLPGGINSTNSIAITANTTGVSNITLVANGAAGNSTFVFDSSGNLTSPGNVYAPAFIGSGQYLGNLLLNSTVGNIVLDIANTNSNVSNTNSLLSNTIANVTTLTTGLANTNANVANTNSNVSNLTLTVANITANIGNLEGSTYSNANAAAYLQVYGGNVYANNINGIGNVSAQYVSSAGDMYAAGNLYVNNGDTTFDSTEITSNVVTLTLNHDVTTITPSLDGTGLLVGQNGLVSWLYDYDTNAWQSSTSIQPNGTPHDLGNTFNPWGNVYAGNVIAGAFTTTAVGANVATVGDLSVYGNANVSTLAVGNNASIDGDLNVGNSTLINALAISSKANLLILDKDNALGYYANGSGIQIGSPSVANLLYNYDTGSWQSSIDITPYSNITANLGETTNQWLNVYAVNVEAGNVNAANVFGDSVYGNTVFALGNVYSDILFGNTASVTGSVTANVVTAQSVVGLVTTAAQPQITSVGNLTALTVVGNVTASYFIGNGSQLTGLPASYGNANVADYLPTYTGNITASDISVNGNVTANYFIGDGSQLTAVAANTATTAATVTTNVQPNITSVGTLTSLTTTGNVTADYVFANGAVFTNDISVTGTITAGNINANVTGVITQAINVTGNSQPNITSVGNLTSLTVTGNTTANYYFGDGSQLTGVVTSLSGNLQGNISANSYYITDLLELSVNGNIISNNFFVGNGAYLTGLPASYGNANVADYLPTYTGNVTAGNISVTGNITGSYLFGNGALITGLPAGYSNTQVAEYLPTYSGNLNSVDTITATGNITANYYSGNGSQLTGMYSNAVAANYLPTYSGELTSVGNIISTGYISTVGNIDAGGMLITGNVIITGNANVQGNLTYNDITNLTTDNLVLGLGNNQTGINVTGAGIVVGNTNEASLLYDFTTQSWNSNISISVNGNVLANAFVGDGSNVANVIALTVSDNAQPNVTSVGDLVVLTVVGNTVSGNFFTGGTISATGNIDSAGNISADYYIGNGSLLSDIVANVNQLTNGSYAVSLNSTGTVEYPLVDDQQQAITGSTTTVYGDPYTIEVLPGLTDIIWTATSNAVIGFKMSVRAQAGNATISNLEMADIVCSWDGTRIANTIANASYTISNRVKSNVSAPDTQYQILTNGIGSLIVRATNNDTSNLYFTHSVVEFNKTT